jgi:hypothetical protein
VERGPQTQAKGGGVKKSRCTHVYVAGLEHGPVKIGMTSNPRTRPSSACGAAKLGFDKLYWTAQHKHADRIESGSHWHLLCYEAGQEWFFISFPRAVAAVEEVMERWDRGVHYSENLYPYYQELVDRAKQSYIDSLNHPIHFAFGPPKVKKLLPLFKTAKKKFLSVKKNAAAFARYQSELRVKGLYYA